MIVGVLLGILIGVIGTGYMAFARQQQAHIEAVSFIQGVLDRERAECKVYRNLLFPVLAKAQPTLSTEHTVAAQLEKYPNKQAFDRPVLDKRTPFRIRFKQGMAKLNTKQRNTDALAAALAKQPSQEKTNV